MTDVKEPLWITLMRNLPPVPQKDDPNFEEKMKECLRADGEMLRARKDWEKNK